MGPELFDEVGFEAADVHRWRELVAKALKGADFDETLVSRTDDGIAYGPIAGRDAGGKVHARCAPARPWTVSQRVDDPEAERAATQLKADIDGGASGLNFCFRGSAAAHGYGIHPAAFSRLLETASTIEEIRIEGTGSTVADVIGCFEKRDETAGHVDFGIFPADTGETEALGEVASRAFDLDIACTVFRADGRPAHNAGASQAQELGFALAAAAEALRLCEKQGVDAESALAATEFALSVDHDQFLSIAKLRAMRRLHARLSAALSIAEPFAAHIHAETSWRMLTRLDPETNILRNTIAVFAAGVGGADSVSVLPHSFALGLPDRFARRIARNTQTVLLEESHLAHVVDPGAGAGGIERLTADIAAAAWAEFQAIEREGGLRVSLAGRLITARIEQMRDRRLEAVARGTVALVGTSVYPMQKERDINVLIPAKEAEASASPLVATPLHAGWKMGDAA